MITYETKHSGVVSMRYPELKGKCINCIGCYRIEDKSFIGVLRCQYYIAYKEEK